jgi:hypothetical protein
MLALKTTGKVESVGDHQWNEQENYRRRRERLEQRTHARTRENRETRDLVLLNGAAFFLAFFPFNLATNAGGHTTHTTRNARHAA